MTILLPKKSREEKKSEKNKENKAVTVQRLTKSKHSSYSANWINKIGTVAIIQNLKKKQFQMCTVGALVLFILISEGHGHWANSIVLCSLISWFVGVDCNFI